MKFLVFPIWLCLLSLAIPPADSMEQIQFGEEESRQLFDSLVALPWTNELEDDMTQNWEKNWTLDGKLASITHSEEGMDFWAGPKPKVDSNHAVMWTRQSFEGDIRLDYTYTKIDESPSFVTILYVQATGSGAQGYEEDISTWADNREIPSMRTYFRHMNALHISYAASGTYKGEHPKAGQKYDYIRGRRYLPERVPGLAGTQMDPNYFDTGLFEHGVPYKITVIKHGMDFFMYCRSAEKEQLCHWRMDKHPPIVKGRIGLRHMYTRGARYKDFRIAILPD